MKNEGGYTLIEILAGVFILSIVLTVFFQFFIFSQKTTTDNKEQLVALKLAETVLEQIISNKNGYQDDFVYVEGEPQAQTYSCEKEDTTCNDRYYFMFNNNEYEAQITVGAQQEDLRIYKITVKIYGEMNKEKPLSEVKGLVEL
ncbi:type IV pilus modification PilV family protein [Bacillus benzoevorans]|uniref:Prepilin-type N-terminal cleavage/methylation domain-containing protein n=1 Tax=Bacillus benzoevorans TaxID=1456 RepID=A0A7X0LVC9_9BACI|nr:type II secretion system protein [Bacillus benzoevorans]MBB6445856.1 prepilin-type N-terminal cleavage/methylation domain-containing protein [Bacillus benzoevorans]